MPASIAGVTYSHWLPATSREKVVDVLDDASSRVTQTSPMAFDENDQRALSGLSSVVSLNFASWNQLERWLRRLEALRTAA
jgi:hypothetical protein